MTITFNTVFTVRQAPPLSASTRYIILGLGLSLLLAGCGSRSSTDSNSSNTVSASDTLAQIKASAITVNGRVTSTTGLPIAGARINAGDATTSTDVEGAFTLALANRNNRLLIVEAIGYGSETISTHLLLAASTLTLSLAPIVLEARDEHTQRLLFGGDTSFGRRFLDPANTGRMTAIPADNPEAWIQASSPETGTIKLVERLEPYFKQSDFSSVNLETPVTDTPTTPHPTKEFAFFTLPRSLRALNWLGINYAGLGNNHVYDFQADSLASTLAHLDARSIGHSGAGSTADAAFSPYLHALKSGITLALISATSIDGKNSCIPSDQPCLSYVASANIKGGAANAKDPDDTDKKFPEVVAQFASTNFVVAQYHGGVEYSAGPTSAGVTRMKSLAKAGARLVVAHHPHTAQSVGRDKDSGTYLVHSLGNMVFDQDRHDTSFGLLARAEIDQQETRRLRLLPIYHKNFRPHPVGGEVANRLLRRLGETAEDDVLVFPYLGQGWVVADRTLANSTDRNIAIPVVIPVSGHLILDLRDHLNAEESLATLQADRPLEVKLGRDLFLFGDNESYDFSETAFDGNHWATDAGSRFCDRGARRGVAGLCSVRAATDGGPSVFSTSQRIRPEGDAINTPNKDLTLLVYYRQQNSGAIKVEAAYFASTKEKTFGANSLAEIPAGSKEWTVLVEDIKLPADINDVTLNPEIDQPRAVRIYITQQIPEKRTGEAHFDDLAIISWQGTAQAAPLTRSTPNSVDFVQITGTPGPANVTITGRKYTPRS